MTDNEIIKALECCGRQGNCEGCPLNLEKAAHGSICIVALQDGAFDLINRQNAEVERLKSERDKLLKECKKCGRKTQRKISKLQKQNLELLDMCAEQGEKAIKEFWERFKNDCREIPYVLPSIYLIGDKILKEMVGAE